MSKIPSALLLACLLMPGASALGAEETAKTPQAAIQPVPEEKLLFLIKSLAANDYALRETSTLELVKIGEAALPALKKAEASEDPEAAWRATAAAHMIRWKLTPEMWARMGDLMEEYEVSDPAVRERIVRILRFASDSAALPVLREVLRKETDADVRQTAALMLADLGAEGLNVLVEEGVKIAGLDPFDAGVHVLLGNSFLKDKNYKKAEEHYLKALEIQPDEYIAMYNLACVYSLQKKIDDAIQWLVKSVDAGYDDFEWMEKDTDLDNLRNDARYKEIIRKGAKAPKEKPAEPPPDEPPPAPPEDKPDDQQD